MVIKLGFFQSVDQRGNYLQAKASLSLNSTVVGVCSTPGAVREAPRDPVSGRRPECELDIIHETVERAEYGKKTKKEAESSEWHNAESW